MQSHSTNVGWLFLLAGMGGGVRRLVQQLRWGIQATLTTLSAFWQALPGFAQLLIWLMLIDTVLGIMLAIRRRDISAQRARDGANKKVGALLLVAVAALVKFYVPLPIEIDLVQAASAFYCMSELISIGRNAALLNVPVFVQFQSILRYFQTVAGDTSAVEEKTPK